ncbi:LOW QUALITY PROTEIN: glia maturation factor beta [Diretmus argenteus]
MGGIVHDGQFGPHPPIGHLLHSVQGWDACVGLVKPVTRCVCVREVKKTKKTLKASVSSRTTAAAPGDFFRYKMSESLVVCDVDEDLVKKLTEFRFRKETNNAAIIMKIDKEKDLVILEAEHDDISPDELKEELPERQPRYPLNDTPGTFIVYSYKYQHDDGRVSYPLCFIFSSPVGCKPEQQMMYAGSKNKLVQTVKLTKVFEIRNTEDLTEEWLREKLGFFR